MAPIACVPARRWKWPRLARRSRRRRPDPIKEGVGRKAADEPLPAFHPPPGGDLAANAGGIARRLCRVSRAADLGAAAGRLPDDPGLHLLSRREPRGDGFVGDRAARTPVRPDAGPEADALDELRRG